jgi:hypothetical protein
MLLLIGDVVMMFLPTRKIDHASHLGGALAGFIGAETWLRSEGVYEGKKELKKGQRWYEHLLGKELFVEKK